jgi:hypothetical protein
MKKVLAVACAVLAMAPAVVFAKGGNHPMAGCGLGYVLFGNEKNESIMQILAATTNGTSGNQTFGMTSGTSGCTADGAVKFVKEAEVFAEVNLDTLRREMSVGDGEFVRTFASLIGSKDVDSTLGMFKANYETLFPSASTSSGEFMAALSGVLSSNSL